MTKYVVSGYIGFDNFGDEAVAGVLINHLKQSGAEKITVLSSNPQKTSREYGVDSSFMLKFFKPISESDVLISGGGSLLQDLTSLKSLIYYLAVIMTALVLNKKVYVFAQGFSPFRTKIGELLTRFALKHCKYISVRDERSRNLLSNWGIESELVSDPVFELKIPPVNTHSGIGVQLREYTSLNDEFMRALAKSLSERFKNEKIKLFSLQDTHDLAVIEKFASMLSSYGIASEIFKNTSVEQTAIELSKLEYIISMRFHSCLICAKSGVKTLGIKYDMKVKNLSETIGFPSINPYVSEIDDGIEELLKTDSDNYTIPDFKFPDVL